MEKINWWKRSNERTLLEMSISRDKYMTRVSDKELSIFCHVAYILLYNDSMNTNHWKRELFGFVAQLKRVTMVGGNKKKATREALINEIYGEDFSEFDLDDEEKLESMCEAVINSEEIPRPFDVDLSIEENKRVFKDAVEVFYTFLVNWISDTDKNPTADELYMAVDSILLSAKKKLV